MAHFTCTQFEHSSLKLYFIFSIHCLAPSFSCESPFCNWSVDKYEVPKLSKPQIPLFPKLVRPGKKHISCVFFHPILFRDYTQLKPWYIHWNWNNVRQPVDYAVDRPKQILCECMVPSCGPRHKKTSLTSEQLCAYIIIIHWSWCL